MPVAIPWLPPRARAPINRGIDAPRTLPLYLRNRGYFVLGKGKLFHGHPELHHYRANLHKRVAIGANARWAELTALQLAVRLGDKDMVRFILHRHCTVMWSWGSLSQKRFDLAEIDSINPGAQSVMELIVHIDANERTRSMLGIGSKAESMARSCPSQRTPRRP